MKIYQYLAILLAFFANKNLLPANILTVNTLTDIATGAGTSGSLRYLMGIAVDGDTINFDPSLTGSIVLDNSLGNLPPITIDHLAITGNLITNSGVPTTIPMVSIDGQNLPADPYTTCFDIQNTNPSAIYTIANLSFINFAGNGYSAGIRSGSFAGTINISNCYFGTNDGVTIDSNVFGIALTDGLTTATLNLTNSIITGSTGAPFQAWRFKEVNVSGCIIGGNRQPGMDFQSCNGGTITSNLVGVTANGLSANSNENGIFLLNCDKFIVGGSAENRNICSGNGNQGVQLSNCTNCTVSYNYLGTNITGTAAIPNIGNGVSIDSDTSTVSNNNTISNNLISGNSNYGIRLSTSISPDAITNCTISDNLIGTNADGTSAIANFYDGIGINIINYGGGANNQGSISNNTIRDNLISGNSRHGISLNNNATKNFFSNNKIGTKIDGITALPNVGHGIFINSYDTACNSNTFGGYNSMVSGISVTYSNIIAYNTGQGINMTPVPANLTSNPPSTAPQTTLNSFLQNSIFGNANPQIYLTSGENNDQAAPIISQAILSSLEGTANSLYLEGTAPSNFDDRNLKLDFFATPSSLSATNPQGKIYLGTINSVDAGNNYQILLAGFTPIDNTYYITGIATAYDNTSASLGDSSPFSSAIIPTYDTHTTLGTLTAAPNPITSGSPTTLSITFSGGIAPYTAVWSDGHTSIITSSPVTYSPTPIVDTGYYVNIIDALGNNSGSSNTVNVLISTGPIISNISADPIQVNWGQSSNITATFNSGTAPYTANWNDYISGIINSLVVSGVTSPYIRNVTPELTTLYSLQVGDSLGLLSPAATITIPVGPHITSFTATNNPIAPGGSTTLNVSFVGGTSPFTATWYANSAIISGATSISSIVVSPTSNTSYYVIIKDKNNLYSTSNLINIAVDSGATITSISATPTTVLSGASSNLEVIFSGGVAPYTARWSDSTTVTGVSSPYTRIVNPTATTSYQVQIIDSLGVESPSATTEVTVNGSPTISTLTVSPSVIAPNQNAIITLSFDPGSGPCTVDWGDGSSSINASSPISHTVAPASTTSYTITVTNDFGDATQGITVNVITPPSSNLFTAHLLTKYYGKV